MSYNPNGSLSFQHLPALPRGFPARLYSACTNRTGLSSPWIIASKSRTRLCVRWSFADTESSLNNMQHEGVAITTCGSSLQFSMLSPSKLFYLAESRRRWRVVHSKNQLASIFKGKEYTTILTEFISSIYNTNELHQLSYHIRATWASDPTSWAESGYRTHRPRKRPRELLKHTWSQQSKWENALDCRILNYVDITWEFWSFLLFTLKKSDSVIYWCSRCSNVDSTTSRNMVCSQLAGTWYAPRLLSIWYMGSAAEWNPVSTLKYIYTQWELCRSTPANFFSLPISFPSLTASFFFFSLLACRGWLSPDLSCLLAVFGRARRCWIDK